MALLRSSSPTCEPTISGGIHHDGGVDRLQRILDALLDHFAGLVLQPAGEIATSRDVPKVCT